MLLKCIIGSCVLHVKRNIYTNEISTVNEIPTMNEISTMIEKAYVLSYKIQKYIKQCLIVAIMYTCINLTSRELSFTVNTSIPQLSEYFAKSVKTYNDIIF